MDIASVSTALSNVQTQNAVSTAVFSMTLDDFKAQGEMMTEMLPDTKSMEMSVNPHLGGNFDSYA